MEKGTKSLIACFVLAITIILMSGIWSCGKRMTTTVQTEIKNDSLFIENSIELTQNATWNDIGSVKPFDPLKPMLWQGKWYYNTVIEFDKSIKSELDIKGKDNLSYEGSESITKEKNTESNNRNLLWIGLSFVAGLLFIVYLSLKKLNLV